MDDVDITVRGGDDELLPLVRLEPNGAKQMLGVYLAEDGNSTIQVKEIRDIAERWHINSG